jgi:hypothetical protein
MTALASRRAISLTFFSVTAMNVDYIPACSLCKICGSVWRNAPGGGYPSFGATSKPPSGCFLEDRMQYGCNCSRGLADNGGTIPAWAGIATIGTAFIGVALFAWMFAKDQPAPPTFRRY